MRESSTASLVLELTAASRRYGALTALHPLSLRVERGTVCLAHGANGSGKTTLLRLCSGLLSPTTGERWACGRSLYLRPGSGARPRQTVHDVLATAAALAGRPRAGVPESLEVAGLTPLGGRRVETLSSGQRARLLVGLSLVVTPPLVCLDEPTAHLDADGLSTVHEGLRRLVDAGTAVLVATHDRGLVARPDARFIIEDGVVRPAA